MPVSPRRPRFPRLCIPLLLAAAILTAAGQAAWALRFDRDEVTQYAQGKYGASGAGRLRQWFSLLDRAASTPDIRARLASVNDFWNMNVQEGTDLAIWKQEDYWATPLETLTRGMADCEDFVIGKYFSLVHLGVPADKLRLIYVRAQVGGQSIAHMVLGYYETPDADPLILDNLMHAIRPAAQRRDLTPVFSFNAEGVYVAGAVSSGVERITRWQAVLSRMRQEGFLP